MNHLEVFDYCWQRLAADLANESKPPSYLAHYCSTSVLENIIKTRQLWFSNPLFMNDLEEVKFGMKAGMHAVGNNESLRSSLGTEKRRSMFTEAFENYFSEYSASTVFDLYLICLSEHRKADVHGRLSMWRAYGANGDGAAIVLDPNVVGEPGAFDGLLFGRVHYGSTEEREAWLEEKVVEAGNIIRTIEFPDEQLHLVAAALFERVKLMAIFSKHSGFSEEAEWRLVYMHERDTTKCYEKFLDYSVGPRGIEPKLKLPIHGDVPWQAESFDFDSVVHEIILGPTASSPLSIMSVGRMLKLRGMPELAKKLRASEIPFRQNTR